jgi:hypothetical protein
MVWMARRLRVPDSEANRHEFGLIVGRLAPQGSGYPVMRAVALMALRSHMLAAVAFGPCKHGEHTYARQLWGEIPDNSLTIVDRGFQASNVLHPLAATPERSSENPVSILQNAKGNRPGAPK